MYLDLFIPFARLQFFPNEIISDRTHIGTHVCSSNRFSRRQLTRLIPVVWLNYAWQILQDDLPSENVEARTHRPRLTAIKISWRISIVSSVRTRRARSGRDRLRGIGLVCCAFIYSPPCYFLNVFCVSLRLWRFCIIKTFLFPFLFYDKYILWRL